MSSQIIKGKLLNQQTGIGLPNLDIRAWDKDIKRNDFLGQSRSNEKGDFSIEVVGQFLDHPKEKLPDLFFEVFDNAGELIFSEKRPRTNWSWDEGPIILAIPYPLAQNSDVEDGNRGESPKEPTESVFTLSDEQQLQVTNLLSLAEIQNAETIISKLASTIDSNTINWNKLADDQIITLDQSNKLQTIYTLNSFTANNFSLVNALNNKGVLALENLIEYTTEDWNEILKTEEIELPAGFKDKTIYATFLENRITNLYPNRVFIHRLNINETEDLSIDLETIDNFLSINPEITSGQSRLSEINWGTTSKAQIENIENGLNSLKKLSNLYSHLGIAEIAFGTNQNNAEKTILIQTKIKQFKNLLNEYQGLDLLRYDFQEKANNEINLPDTDNWNLESFGDRDASIAQLKAYQRVMQLNLRFDTVKLMLENGFDSAMKVSLTQKEDFFSKFNEPPIAKQVYQNAVDFTHQTNLHFMNILNGRGVDLFGQSLVANLNPDFKSSYKHLAGYKDLFGDDSACSCEECKSIFSPLAYFVELMRFVDLHITNSKSANIPKGQKLQERRPDLWEIPLTCSNANDTISYAQLIIEILEHNIIKETTSGSERDLINPLANGTTLFNLGEVVNFTSLVTNIASNILPTEKQKLYIKLANTNYPWSLPFNLSRSQILLYFKHFATPLHKFLEISGADIASVRRESLTISPSEYRFLTKENTSVAALEAIYGVKDLRELYPLDGFLLKTRLSRKELDSLISRNFSEKEVKDGALKTIFIQDTEDVFPLKIEMVSGEERLPELSHKRLDRIARFIRLSKLTNWNYQDLNIAIAASGEPKNINTNVIETVAIVQQFVQTYKISVAETCSLFAAMEHFGADNLFDQVYNNKLNSDATTYTYNSNIIWNYNQENNKESRRLIGSLQLNDEDLKQIAQFVKPIIDPNNSYGENNIALNLEGLSALHRYSLLSKIFRTKVPDFIKVLGFLELSKGIQSKENLVQLFDFYQWIIETPFTIQELLEIAGLKKNEGSLQIAEGVTQLTTLREQEKQIKKSYASQIEETEINAQENYASKVNIINERAKERILEATTESEKARIEEKRKTAIIETKALVEKKKKAALIKIDESIEKDKEQSLYNQLSILLNQQPPFTQKLVALLIQKLVPPTNPPSAKRPLEQLTAIFYPTTMPIEEKQVKAVIAIIEELQRFNLLAQKLELQEETLEEMTTSPQHYGVADRTQINLSMIQELTRFSKLSSKYGSQKQWIECLNSTEQIESLATLLKTKKLNIERAIKQISSNGLTPNVIEFSKVASLISLTKEFGTNLETLFSWTAINPFLIDENIYSAEIEVANSMHEVLKSLHNKESWLRLHSSIEEELLEQKKKALVAYAIDYLNELPNFPRVRSADDLYEHLLIDVQMSSCAQISKIKEGISALQIYIQRCQLNLENGVSPSNIKEKQWEWMKNYRVWEANRKVFLYPENYIEPELRLNKTNLFKELEEELMQGELTEANVEKAGLAYLNKFNDLANLITTGAYYDDQTGNIHLLGRTKIEPYQYYHRIYNDTKKSWTNWTHIDVNISNTYASPCFHFNRLYVFWVEMKSLNKPTSLLEQKMVNIATIKYAYRDVNGNWTPPQTVIEIEDWLSFSYSYKLFPFIKGNKIVVFSQKEIENKQTNIAYSIDAYGDVKEYNIPSSQSKNEKIISSVSLFITKQISNWTDRTSGGRTSGGEKGVNIGQGEVLKTETIEILSQTKYFETVSSHLNKSEYFSSMESKNAFIKNGIVLAKASSHRDLHVINNKRGWYLFSNSDEEFLIKMKGTSYEFLRTSTSLAPKLIKILMGGGIKKFLSTETQLEEELDFKTKYVPAQNVVLLETHLKKGPKAQAKGLEFEGPYGQYFKEIFFHMPFLIANKLNKDQRFEEAQKWYHLIFNPIPSNWNKTQNKDNYWNYLPFKNQTSKSFELLLNDPKEIVKYKENPFRPHAIAALRVTAYQKSIFAKYLDNLLDWADSLFARDSWESITEATILYVLAYQMLGKENENKATCNTSEKATFARIKQRYGNGIPEFIIELENAIKYVKNSSPYPDTSSSYPDPTNPFGTASHTGEGFLPYSPDSESADTINGVEIGKENKDGVNSFVPAETGMDGMMNTTAVITSAWLFCIPENDSLEQYRDRVKDRLFKLRHCMDIDGLKRKLALFEPPLDPMALVRAIAGGNKIGMVLNTLNAEVSHFRFQYLLERAKQFTATVQQLGNAFLSALEKKDAEILNSLQFVHQKAILQLTTGIKNKSIQEAKENLESLKVSRENSLLRHKYYSNLVASGLSGHESSQLELMAMSQMFSMLSKSLGMMSSVAHLVPNVGAPTAMTYGGREIGASLGMYGNFFEMVSSAMSFGASQSSILGSYGRREQEWKFQSELSSNEEKQIKKQINAAEFRLNIAEKDLEVHFAQIESNEKQYEFLKSKFTNSELYQWLEGKLFTLYFQSYKMAYDLAKKAEKAYQFEQNALESESYINLGHWDSGKKGLLAGEKLMLELNQLEKAYIDSDKRELEIEKTVSLAQLKNYSPGIGWPTALLALIHEGKCNFKLDQQLFDMDYPSHHTRKIRSISISIPAVISPYENIKATLRQTKSTIRFGNKGTQERTNWLRNQEVAISSGVNDSGMFELNFRSERYLAFEGTGVESEWELEMPKEANNFDYNSLTDVIIRVQYTAINETNIEYRKDIIKALKPLQGYRFFSLKHESPEEWHWFLNPDKETDHLSLKFKVNPNNFPQNLAGIKIDQIGLIVETEELVNASFMIEDQESGQKVNISLKETLPIGEITTNTLKFGNWELSIPRTDLPAKWSKMVDGKATIDPDKLQNIGIVLHFSAKSKWQTTNP